jgi:hypothetical protein
MATGSECFECGYTAAPRAWRMSLKRLLKIVAVVAIASVLMYAEIWAIQEGPILSGTDVLELTGSANSDTDGPFRDTAGPVAVLH